MAGSEPAILIKRFIMAKHKEDNNINSIPLDVLSILSNFNTTHSDTIHDVSSKEDE